MKRRTITFLPENRSVQVDEGVTIAEAAQIAEIIMNNLCGGEGVCGGCRLRVTRGHAEADEHARSLLSKAELEEGYVLACQTPIYDDLHVVIPPQSRMEEAKIMTGEASDTSAVSEDFPLVRKIHLELPCPSLEDNLADMERISRELRRKIGWHSYEILLPCLQNLSNSLRQHDFRVTATVAKDKNGYRILRTEPSDATRSNYGVAVDVGTTTVVVQLVDIATGKVVGVDASYNLQASYGEDVISRMIYACGKGGLDPLHQAVVKNINRLIGKLTGEKGIPLEEINAVVAAGNTTMSHFLLGLTPCSIRLDPYVPTAYVYPQILAKDVGIRINPNGILETIPSVASYVGGDIVAGVMSSGIADHPEVRGLIDIGTNGEIAIGNNEWLVCCSASAGPAFEGGGTTCGMRAARGAIEKVEITNGKLSYQTIGNTSPRGICGSGLIDCIYELVKNKIIGADGKFHRDSQDTRLSMKDDVPQYIIATSEESETEKSIVITESDIENLIRSKGAVFAAIKSLMEYIGLGFEQIETFYVAGGFGTFLNVSKAVAIGLLPDISREKIRFIGNSSLTGARKCLLSESALEKCLNISRSMTNVELSAYQPFMDEFIAALFLPHTDRRLFPSITY